MPNITRFEQALARNPVEVASIFQRLYGGMSVSTPPGSRVEAQIESAILEGVIAHRIETRSYLSIRVDKGFEQRLALVMIRNGIVHARIDGQAQSWTTGACIMFDSASMEESQWEPGSYEIVVVAAGEIKKRLACLLAVPVTRSIKFETDIDADSDGIYLVRSTAQLIHAAFASGKLSAATTAVATSMHDLMVATFLEALPHSYSIDLRERPPTLSPAYVKKAIDYMDTHAQESISVSDIAGNAQTSVRNLQAGFSSFRGTTPMAYLRELRLKRARADLLHPSTESVAEVAARWQFPHPSLFARVYREAFGELPSETLRRAQHEHGRDGT